MKTYEYEYGCREWLIALVCEHNGKLLMLHRNRHKHFCGFRTRWMSVVGRKPYKQNLATAADRIFQKETGLKATKLRYHGQVMLFDPSGQPPLGVLLFEVRKWEGTLLPDSYYGTYEWVPKERIYGAWYQHKKLWLPDHILLKTMAMNYRRLVLLDILATPDQTVLDARAYWERKRPEPLTPREWVE